eukprot:m51a1_g1192 putative calpain family cysteine protease (507) ;mRNA; f:426295-429631
MLFETALVAPRPLRFCNHSYSSNPCQDDTHCKSKAAAQQQDSELREILLSPCLPGQEVFQHELFATEFTMPLPDVGASPLPERVSNPLAAHLERESRHRRSYAGSISAHVTPAELGAELGLLSLSPAPIRALFRDHTENDRGLYVVSFVIDGVPKKLLIDDRIPCDAKTRKPLFSHTKGLDLWVMLLEKAYAKEHGSYRAIESGVPGDALADLTGAPFRVFKTADLGSARTFKEIENDDRKNFAICAGVPNVPDVDLMKTVGLVEGHAYSVLRAHRTSNGTCILQVRNPWGKVEWNGAYSDKDPNWTPELKQELEWSNSDDGTFWMPAEDFVKYYDQVSVLYVDEKWAFSNCQLTLSAALTGFTLKVPAKTRLYLTAHQRRGRTAVSLRYCVVNKATGAPIGGTGEPYVQSETLSCKELRLDEGEYSIILEVYSDQARLLPVPFTVSCYSEVAGPTVTLDEGKPKWSFTLPEFADKYGTCGSCSQPLSGSYFSVGGKNKQTASHRS